MLIDTHCHLTFPELMPQVGSVLDRAAQAGVTRVITVATSVADGRAAFQVLQQHEQVFMAAGIHPHEAGKCTPADLETIAAWHRGDVPEDVAGRIVAVGETGLDFHYDFAPRARQEEVFRFHLDLGVRANRPVVIHARESEERVCDILVDYPALMGRVVFHCYSGSAAVARRILDMGNFLSFTGIVTFANADNVRDMLRMAPGERIVLETDAPYLSPVPVRKVRPNEPAFVVHTARFAAELRKEPFEALAEQTTENARRFFSLS